MKSFFFSLTDFEKFLLLIFVVFFLAIVFFLLGKSFGSLKTELKFKDKIKNSRDDAVKRSKAVLGGLFQEQIAPFLPDFPCDAQDVRFIGKPVDFIGFSGISSDNEISEILFIEVKSGGSKLSEREKQIKKAVEEKRVRYVEYRCPQID